jgi:hypothetical protein
VKQLHDNGYRFVGDESFYRLTLPETRVLLEGANVQQQKKAKKSGHTQGSGPHERAPGEHRDSDEEWVQQLNQQNAS